MAARSLGAFITALCLFIAAPQAIADHSNPREELASIEGDPAGQGVPRGTGTWEHIQNFKANPGTDVELFKIKQTIYGSAGTLGQADAEHVGQRMFRLVTKKGFVKPKWLADHGSAHCPTANPSGTTGLQHDVQVTPPLGKGRAKLIIDTTDATGRCHDPGGGGLEFIDVSKLNRKNFEPREIHLTRHQGTTHTVTVDAKRPWIVYSSNAGFTGLNWIDVLNIKSCLLSKKTPLEVKRKKCRPSVYRIMFEPDWSSPTTQDGTGLREEAASCHDITSVGYRLYCAALNATLILDTKNMTTTDGRVKGEPLACELIDGTGTGAKVTDCSAPIEGAVPQARGWKFLGTFNHPGRNCGAEGQVTCNNNLVVPAAEGVAVSHEADPTQDGNHMFVTDERGGGIVPGGASCEPGNAGNPYQNGGVHLFDISDPADIKYVTDPDGNPAVFRTDPVAPSATFCTAHVMDIIPDEQRFVIAWYSQGVKVVDWFFDQDGNAVFREAASFTLPGTNAWAAQPFKIVENDDGTRTYFMLINDIERGQDIVSWTGEPNPIGSPPPAVPVQALRGPG